MRGILPGSKARASLTDTPEPCRGGRMEPGRVRSLCIRLTARGDDVPDSGAGIIAHGTQRLRTMLGWRGRKIGFDQIAQAAMPVSVEDLDAVARF